MAAVGCPATMNEKDHLKAELRAVREELARRNIKPNAAHELGSLMYPPRDVQFIRLKELETEQLNDHEERLERDIEDIENGIEAGDDDP